MRRALLTRAPRLWSAQRIDLEAQGALVAPAFVLDVPLQPEAEPDELLQALRSVASVISQMRCSAVSSW